MIDGRFSNKVLRVLYIGLKNDYGIPNRGLSYEWINFLGTLQQMEGIEVLKFPFDEVMRQTGRDEMNRGLLKLVEEEKPDMCFFVLFTDEIKKETICHIGEKSGAITFNWFTDDHWRFRSFSRSWAPLFHWVLTTDFRAIERYRKIGVHQVILTQWAVNHHTSTRAEIESKYDITFIGQVHSSRRNSIDTLSMSGLKVECWGKGWNNGRLPQEEFARTVVQSKINLNFSDSSNRFSIKPLAKIFLKRRADDTLQINTMPLMVNHLRALLFDHCPQIKARTFEIPGYGGFLLTSYVEGLEQYYKLEEEICTFRSANELIEKCRYYLENEKERKRIMQAGWERTHLEHTYEKRFQKIFSQTGILTASQAKVIL